MTPDGRGAASAREQSRRLSDTSAAVLGMVAIGARSGYEIRRAAELSLRFFWALGPPQIYAGLAGLEEAGLVVGTGETHGRRARRVFAITAAGRAALRGWLTASELDGVELRDPALLRLFFADAVEHEDVVGHLRAMRGRSERALLAFEDQILPAATRTAARGFGYPEIVARFGAELHEFIAGWCERTLEEMDDAA